MRPRPMYGILYIVSTPIGNLEDMTFRAVRVLKEVGVIAAEDTRHTKQLCTHFVIHTPLTSYHDFNKEEKTAVLLAGLGNRRAVLARELTKHYEEFHRGSLEELIALVRSRPPKGEITLVIEGAPTRRRSAPGEEAGQEQEREDE